MTRTVTLLLATAVLTASLVLGGCGGQDNTAGPSVDTAANPYAGRFFGKATTGTSFVAALTVDISGGTVNAAMLGPDISGIFAGTGTCTALGAVAFTISVKNDGTPAQYNFTGTMRSEGGVVSGSGTWSSPTAGSGKWALTVLKNAAKTGSWTLTKSGSPNRVFSYDRAWVGLVRTGGMVMLAMFFDRAATPSPVDALIPVGNPAAAALNTPYDLNDFILRWTWAAGEHYYAKETAPAKVTFTKKQLNAGGKVSGTLSATLVPFGSGSGTAGWIVKQQPFTDVIVARDWR
jgi:hypothetical protein